jgi:hypothetical protein
MDSNTYLLVIILRRVMPVNKIPERDSMLITKFGPRLALPVLVCLHDIKRMAFRMEGNENPSTKDEPPE